MHELKLFLRFVTGCSVCITSKITVKFNNLACHPIVRTCDFVLELSTSYLNDDNFYNEFRSIFDTTEHEFWWCIEEQER